MKKQGIDAMIYIGTGSIMRGAKIYHDKNTFSWPQCHPPLGESTPGPYVYETNQPDAIFHVYSDELGDCTKLIRDGYGMPGRQYGNGSIAVMHLTDVIFTSINEELSPLVIQQLGIKLTA